MEPLLPTDPDTNRFFDRVVDELQGYFDYAFDEAVRLAREYYTRFTDAQFCDSIGVPVQDDDFFHHEAPGGIAFRAHYYLGLKGDPKPSSFIEWRASHYDQLKRTKELRKASRRS